MGQDVVHLVAMGLQVLEPMGHLPGGPAVYLAMDAPRLDTLSVLFDGAAEVIGRPSPSR